MKNIMKLILTLICSSCISISFADDEVVIGKGYSSLSIKPKTSSECQMTSIERYKRHFLYPDYHDYYLITQDFEVGRGCFEGYHPAKVSVNAKKVDVRNGHVSKKPAWSFTTSGSDGYQAKLSSDLYVVVNSGCCAAIPTYKYFSLSSGNIIGASNDEETPFCIVSYAPSYASTNKRRFIFAQSDESSEYLGDSRSDLTIFYSDDKTIKQEIAIYLPHQNRPYYLGALKIAKINDCRATNYCYLWDKTFNDFSLIVKINEITIEIPIINDVLSPSKAIIKGTTNYKIENVIHKDTRLN